MVVSMPSAVRVPSTPWVPLALLLALATEVLGRKPSIVIAGLFPVTNEESGVGRGVLPAVELAMEHVNAHPTVLRNFTLEMDWNDTKVRTSACHGLSRGWLSGNTTRVVS